MLGDEYHSNGIRQGHGARSYRCYSGRTIQHRYTNSCGRGEFGVGYLLRSLLQAAGLFAGLVLLPAGTLRADDVGARIVIAQAPNEEGPPDAGKQMSPEEKMQRRFPQPIKVGDLIGLPMLDWDDLTIGHVRHVVRTPAGKIQLIVTYGGWFGWRERLVPVPIEVVAILARQLAALDMPRSEFDKAPTWSNSQTTPIAGDEIIKIAVTRR